MVSGRPLIIDEMDHLVDKGAVEIIRDIHDGGQAAIMLIGEEAIPAKLERWERVHSRVLDWKAVQPLDLDDAQLLADYYVRKIIIQPDLVSHIHKLSEGSARRIVVNLALVEEITLRQELQSIDLAGWNGSGQHLYTGKSPAGGRK